MPIRPTPKGEYLVRTRGFIRQKALSISKLSQKVKDISKSIEKKHHDMNPATKNFANDEPLYALNLIAQGNTSATREGLSYQMTNFYMRGTIAWDGTDTIGPVRLMLVLDKNSEGALPAITDVLEATTLSSQYNNVTEGSRFVMLHDKYYHNPRPGTATEKQIKFKKKINRVARNLDSTVTNTTLGRNMLYLLFMSDNATGAANQHINFTARLYFKG